MRYFYNVEKNTITNDREEAMKQWINGDTIEYRTVAGNLIEVWEGLK